MLMNKRVKEPPVEQGLHFQFWDSIGIAISPYVGKNKQKLLDHLTNLDFGIQKSEPKKKKEKVPLYPTPVYAYARK